MSRIGPIAVLIVAGGALSAQTLTQFSDAMQELAARVAPSVVQITVTRYGTHDSARGETSAVLSREQVVGSGAIIDASGYIVTNAHVVSNALRIRVARVTMAAQKNAAPDEAITNSLAQALTPEVDATLVGVFRDFDLALIKIPGDQLPALKFADYRKLRQGQLVFAFGSRRGLGNSMSMGVVSSVARQPDPDSPFVYIQTDAPINPGDSGGPLVNAAGEVVGLDTFILTESGGSEGIGFAIPSPAVQLAAEQLRKYGHMHRQLIGVGVQAVTPILAGALGLPQESGVLISDVDPDGPAAKAGVKLNDIVTGIDGTRVLNVPMFMTGLLSHPGGKDVALDLVRAGKPTVASITPIEETHSGDSIASLINPDKNRIRQLGVVGITIDKDTEKLFPELRGPYGVIVGALAASSSASMTGLQVGDVIHEINGTLVRSIEDLTGALQKLKHGDPVALFIEREGKLQYLGFELQ